MAVADEKSGPDGKVWTLCSIPFWQNNNAPSSSSSSSSSSVIHRVHLQINGHKPAEHSSSQPGVVSAIAKSLRPTKRRLRLDPSNKLYFPFEPGKQVKSAIEIKNTSKNHVAFKFQTTAPKSCYMRPPGGILAPDESTIATVFKFVEPLDNNDKHVDHKRRVKFKIVSLKVKSDMDYVPELFDEQKDRVAVEQILQAVFLDPDHSNPALEKVCRQLAEAEAAAEMRHKPAEETDPKIVGGGLVLDEWKERRERYLAKQQVGGVDLV
ncbi:vesicle-associated protein 4-2-like [Cucumis melo var. makuwa]|uniref:Vesicle-associated protein 4-2-like n=2 Tax=Cucumis melo TaxID=3656 RepID=A0A5D3BT76_CUCMM|nr:vesicle-associated protein 4-2-like [Cucumis melo var. makuwa]